MWRKPLDAEKIKLPKPEIHIISDLCKGCGFCIEFCPKRVLEKSDKLNKRGAFPPEVVDESECALCSFCTAICPEFAIFTIEKKDKEDNQDGEKE
ncbi:MAG: ferredoxin family protein [Candidatus Bathyarchaeota archaeon]|nr:MAG: ferredoxin family protein [Candidatus Bathyarchaeota archaeon]